MSSDTPTIDAARERSRAVLSTLADRLAAESLDGVACVLAVGSLGRLELLPASDLDLVVVLEDGADDDPEIAESAFREVWSVAETLGYERPKVRGIFAEPTTAATLCDPARRGVIDETPAIFGKRMQLLLEGRPVLGEAAARWLVEGILRWYGFGERHPPPFEEWSYLTHDLGRYRHSLAVRYQWLHRDDPATWRMLLLKHLFSRTANLAGLSALVGKSSVSGNPLSFLLDQLLLTPLERLAAISDGESATWFGSAYERFLAAFADDTFRTELAEQGSPRFEELRDVGIGFSDDVTDLLRLRSTAWHPSLRRAPSAFTPADGRVP